MIQEDNVDLFMRRPHLRGVPAAVPPPGFTLRRGPDREAWVAIQTAAEPFVTITSSGANEGSWSHEFVPGEGCVPADVPEDVALSNMFTLVEDSTSLPVGTATAFKTTWHPEACGRKASSGVELATDGLVHWVAVRPEYQGRGLSKTLFSAVLAAHATMGCTTATLHTSSGRPRAIALYLKFDFEPFFDGEADRQAWHKLYLAAAAADTSDPREVKSNRLVVERLAPLFKSE